MSITLSDVQKFTASIAPVDAKGNPALIDGLPTWSVSDPALLSFTPSADGMSVDVLAVGALGTGQLTVSADADLGTGVTTLNGVLDVTVVASQATTLDITTTPPVNQ